MYYSDNSCYGSLATSDPGHVLWQDNPLSQTTVNPANRLLVQLSHGPSHPYRIPHNVAPTDYNFVGYSAVVNTPQGVTQCCPARLSQCMGDTLRQYSAIDGVPVGRSTISVRGLQTCKWVLEDGSICGQTITEGTVPKHLAEHGVQRMPRNQIIQCGWCGCEKHMKRQGVTRHFREVHLGSKRKSHRTCFPETTLIAHNL